MYRFILYFCLLFLLPRTLLAADEPSPAAPAATETSSADTAAPAGTEPPPAAAPARPRILPNQHQQQVDGIVRYLQQHGRAGEIIYPSADNQFLSGFYLKENTGTPQGGILLLHDNNQHAHWPRSLAALREYLPNYGWNTLAINLNPKPEAPLPAPVKPTVDKTTSTPAQVDSNATGADNTADNPPPDPAENSAGADEAGAITQAPAPDTQDLNFPASNTDPSASIAAGLDKVPDISQFQQPAAQPQAVAQNNTPDFQEQISRNIEAGLLFLNNSGQFNLVIIAVGDSANWAVEALNKRLAASGNARGYALILINASASQFPAYALNEQLSRLNMPTLDLISDHESDVSWADKQRRFAMQRNQRSQYSQLQIPDVSSDNEGNITIVTRRIRGWLKTHAAGEEVAVREKRY